LTGPIAALSSAPAHQGCSGARKRLFRSLSRVFYSFARGFCASRTHFA
jgi:hypothetical protein